MAGVGGKSVGRITIRVLRDATKFAADLLVTLRRLEKTLSASIKVDAYTDSLERLLKRLQDRWDGEDVTLNADVDAGVASARLAALTRPRTVSITPKVPTAALAKVGTAIAALSGARPGGDLFSGLAKRLGNLDKALPKIAALATSIGSGALELHPPRGPRGRSRHSLRSRVLDRISRQRLPGRARRGRARRGRARAAVRTPERVDRHRCRNRQLELSARLMDARTSARGARPIIVIVESPCGVDLSEFIRVRIEDNDQRRDQNAQRGDW